MTLLARLGTELPERYYLGLDIGYKEHVAVVISLETFAQGGERHFPTTRAGFAKLQAYLDRFSREPGEFVGICEPTGGFYGATAYDYLLSHGYPTWWVDNSTTKHMREKIMGSIPKTDDIDARVTLAPRCAPPKETA